MLNLQEESSKIISILQEIEKDEKELENLFNKYIYLIKKIKIMMKKIILN